MDPLFVLAAMFGLAAVAPPLARALGRDAGYPMAFAFAVLAAGLALHLPEVVDGAAVAGSVPWLPSLGVRLSVVLDGLSMIFALLVLAVGSLVLAYSARYLRPGAATRRFYGLLALFAASMLGLVMAGDAILLFVCWELTSVTSFFLIGGDGSKEARRAARRVFLVTGLGGLALLAALLLAWVATGTSDLRELVADPAVARGGIGAAVIGLIMLGAFTKSAQVPFHFWLPDAMVAPTPVSAYLHSATMVTAGVFLLARFSPAFAGTAVWLYGLMLVGLVTAVTGAFLALKQYDLKLLLAYSTVSQLGFMVALVGVGTVPALAAAVVLVVAQALYKVALFMVVGIIDRETGSRDIRRLSGLRRAMPITATAAGLAGLSMAGIPPFLGFASKEQAFAALAEAPGVSWLAPAAAGLAVAAAIMTFAYGARIFDGAFAGPLTQDLFEPGKGFLWPPVVAAVAGLGLGAAVVTLDPLVAAAAGTALGPSIGDVDVGLGLWHGVTPALWLSVATIAGGSVLFLRRRRVDVAIHRLRAPVTGPRAFDVVHELVEAIGRVVGRPFMSGTPAAHAGWIAGALVAIGAVAWASGSGIAIGAPPSSLPADRVVAVLVAVAAIGVARARERVAAVALLGVVGFLVATLYVLLGAPDLAITQLLVETLTVAMVVLVFRRLPRVFRTVASTRRAGAAALAVAIGALAGLGTYVFTGRRAPSDVSTYLLAAGPAKAGGRNVVNTILVDFRALDTLGEITVLAVAAVGIMALVRGVDEGPKGTVVLRTADRLLVPAILLLGAYLFLRGHDAPGGGFIAALVVGGALVLHYLAHGTRGVQVTPPVSARVLLGAGLLVAAATGLAGLLSGGELFRTAVWSWSPPGLGSLKVASSLVFDAGVFLVVVAVVVTIVRRFGGEAQ